MDLTHFLYFKNEQQQCEQGNEIYFKEVAFDGQRGNTAELLNPICILKYALRVNRESKQLGNSLKMAQPTANTAVVPAEQLNLKVKSQDGEEVFFKIKSTTQLKKLMDAYCQRQNLNVQNVRFLFDGERLHQNQTPKDLHMENGDEIDVVIEQVGGAMVLLEQ